MNKKMDGMSSPFSDPGVNTGNRKVDHINKNEPLSEKLQQLAKQLPEWDLLPPLKFINRGGNDE
ncbi:MAG: hypothetical protein WB502_04660 [Thermoactinomyces sp.]